MKKFLKFFLSNFLFEIFLGRFLVVTYSTFVDFEKIGIFDFYFFNFLGQFFCPLELENF